jgi:hypothetical protein
MDDFLNLVRILYDGTAEQRPSDDLLALLQIDLNDQVEVEEVDTADDRYSEMLASVKSAASPVDSTAAVANNSGRTGTPSAFSYATGLQETETALDSASERDAQSSTIQIPENVVRKTRRRRSCGSNLIIKKTWSMKRPAVKKTVEPDLSDLDAEWSDSGRSMYSSWSKEDANVNWTEDEDRRSRRSIPKLIGSSSVKKAREDKEKRTSSNPFLRPNSLFDRQSGNWNRNKDYGFLGQHVNDEVERQDLVSVVGHMVMAAAVVRDEVFGSARADRTAMSSIISLSSFKRRKRSASSSTTGTSSSSSEPSLALGGGMLFVSDNNWSTSSENEVTETPSMNLKRNKRTIKRKKVSLPITDM